MLGVICALDAERDAILKLATDIKTEEYIDHVFYLAKINKNDFIITTSGVGKVNASIITSILIQKYYVDFIFNSGIAGGLKEEENPLDIVVGSKLTYHDYDVLLIDNIPKGFTNLDFVFETDKKMSQKIIEICQNENIKCFYEPIVTGDQFVGERSLVESIVKDFPEAYACDMESTAVLHTASKFKIPCCIIRTLSDIAVKDGNHIQYYQVKEQACRVGALIFKALIQGGN